MDWNWESDRVGQEGGMVKGMEIEFNQQKVSRVVRGNMEEIEELGKSKIFLIFNWIYIFVNNRKKLQPRKGNTINKLIY